MRLKSDGQWRPAREIHGGAGYWSQDSVVQVLSHESADEVQVRWPGGKTVTNAVPPEAREILVRYGGELTVLH
jgi:hypothetical protein